MSGGHVVRMRQLQDSSGVKWNSYSVSYWDPGRGLWGSVETFDDKKPQDMARERAYALCSYLNGGREPDEDLW